MSFYTLVTGASTGIGKALATDCAAKGENLVIVARSEEKLAALARELSGLYGVDVRVCSQDLAEPDAASKVFDFCHEKGIGIDRLINCAGFSVAGDFKGMPEEEIVSMAMVNMVAVASLTRRFLPGMIGRGRGSVVNIASIAGFQGVPGMACYSASKAFVVRLTEALAIELRGSGVRIFAVCPGFIDNDQFYATAGHDRRNILVPISGTDVVVRAVRRGLTGRGMLILPTLMDHLLVFSQRFVSRKIAVALAGLFAGATDKR